MKIAGQKPLLGTPLIKGHRLSHGLVGCIPMQDGSGNTYDLITRNPVIPLDANASWQQGKFGHCIYNNGSSNGWHGTTPAGIVYNQPFTIVWWMNIESSGYSQVFLDLKDAGNNTIATIGEWFTDNLIVGNRGPQSATATEIANPGAGWHQFAFVFYGGNDWADTYLIIDAVDVATPSATRVWGNNGTASQMRLLGRLNDAYDPNAYMDSIMIWNRVLSGTDLRELMYLYLYPFCMIGPKTRYIVDPVMPPEAESVFCSMTTDLWFIKHNQGLFTKI